MIILPRWKTKWLLCKSDGVLDEKAELEQEITESKMAGIVDSKTSYRIPEGEILQSGFKG